MQIIAFAYLWEPRLRRVSKAIYNIIKRGDRFMDLGEASLGVNTWQKKLDAITRHAKQLGYNLVQAEG